MYKDLVALYKEYEGRIVALHEEIEDRLRGIDPGRKACNFIDYAPWVQVQVDEPTGELSFIGEDGTEYYHTTFDGVKVVEMLRRDKED